MRSRHRAFTVAVLGTALYGSLIALAWPHLAAMPVLALGIHPLGHMWVFTVGAVTVDVATARYRLHPGEVDLYRRLHVARFNQLLDAVGWNALISRWRGFDGTRATLPGLIRGTRYSENAHVLVAAVGVITAAVALVANEAAVAGWILAFGLIAHPYPIALQRQVRGRALTFLSQVSAVQCVPTGQDEFPDTQPCTGASATASSPSPSPVAKRDLRRP